MTNTSDQWRIQDFPEGVPGAYLDESLLIVRNLELSKM